MTEFEQRVLKELRELNRKFESLKSDFTLSQITVFENLAQDAVVGTDYVAYRFGCRESAVVRGRFETDKIPRFRDKPVKFIKRTVDAVFNEINESVEEKAARYRHNAKAN
jgi:uncharacterized protein with von Willebrand factor type A (vWA) domain